MIQIVLVLVVGAVAVAIAWWLRRRDADAPEQGPSWAVPTQVDRADFDRPDAPWLVVVFTSSTCLSCAATREKAMVLASDEVYAERFRAQGEYVKVTEASLTYVAIDAQGRPRPISQPGS